MRTNRPEKTVHGMAAEEDNRPGPAMSQDALRIREEIIRLASAGPTSLIEIEEKVAGFKAPPGRQSWSYEVDGIAVWDAMTEAGVCALSAAIRSRQIALRPTTRLYYVTQGRIVRGDMWVPCLLVPASWANFASAHRLMSVPDEILEHYSGLVAGQPVPTVFPVRA